MERLREIVAWARPRGVVVASDECYAELAWEEPWASLGVPSLLDERVCDSDHTGLLVAYSLSKQSNLAGYRAAMLAGDPALVGAIREIRKHAGMMMPGPVQRAMAAVLDDDAHVAEQRLDPESVAGLYLWAHGEAPSARIVEALARLGILVAPGTFYGPAGEGWVRLALSATDERIDSAVRRLTSSHLRW